VSLTAGPALVVGACLGALVGAPTLRAGSAVVVAGVLAGAVGLYDDLSGDASTKGLRGHLRELVRGRPTSGALKVPVLGAAGLAAGLVVHGLSVRALLDGAFVAGAANLVNLLDLRPGRAAKVLLVSIAACLGVGATAAAAPAGATLALLPADLRERVMLGDAGANGAGAAVAATALAAIKLPTLLAGLAIVAALTLASEWVSFSRVIERVPALRWLDALGRSA
jgi:UDP-N-acetylmuramyl pentapeptide phosphotransferase/UDP-N-acetylglucosamine-1-phosphate transferase